MWLETFIKRNLGDRDEFYLFFDNLYFPGCNQANIFRSANDRKKTGGQIFMCYFFIGEEQCSITWSGRCHRNAVRSDGLTVLPCS